MRNRRLVAVMLLIAAMAVAAGAAESRWPCWQGVHRDGKSEDTGLLKEWPAGGPAPVWKNDAVGSGFSSPTVGGGLVFVTGDVGPKLVLFALDPKDGSVKWKQDVAAAWNKQYPGARGSATYDDGKVYILSGGGTLVCVDATKQGQKLWSKEMRDFGGEPAHWGYAESPLIHEKLVIVTPGGRTPVVAFDKASGEKAWASSGFQATAHYGSAIAATFEKVPMIIQGSGSGLFAVNPANGQTLWSNGFAANNTANCPSPVYSDGHVFWANGYGKGGVCLKLAVSDGKVTATEAWKTREMDCHHGGYVIVDGFIYGNNGGGWACLELKSGDVRWNAKGVGKGSVCWADGMFYLFSENGGQAGLAACTPEKLEMKGKVKVAGSGPSWAHPIVVGGRLYLRYANNLYCFDVKAK